MKKNKQLMLPIVIISFQDHSANLEGPAEPYQFQAIGVVTKETPDGYQLGHWLDVTTPGKPNTEVTTYIAKVKGLKIKTIGHWVIQ